MQGVQLPLGVHLRDDARFDDFQRGDNAELVEHVRQLASHGGRQLFLHGAIGKTHLLQAACKLAMENGRSTAYLPLHDLRSMGPQVLEGMASRDLLCVDDLQAVAADREWALALMRLCDAVRSRSAGLILAARRAPADLPATVPDLVTRLGWGAVYALKPLSDEDKLLALRLRARARGLEMPLDVGRYLLTRGSRDLPALMDTLSQLDVASLAAKRRLTIPFVKSVMDL